MEEKKRQFPIKASVLLYNLCTITEYINRNPYQRLEALLDFALRKVGEIMDARAGNLRTFDEKRGMLVLKASYGVSEEYKKRKAFIPIGKSIAGKVFEEEKVYPVSDLRKNSNYQKAEFTVREGVLSLICAPLSAQSRKIGVLSVYFPSARVFTPEEVEFFTILATFLSMLIINYQLHREIQQTYLKTIESLVIAMEEKDFYTKGHSERVRDYSVKIAKRLGLPLEEIEIISQMAILHDIGKLTIDSSILNKPEDLSEEEWNLMKQHPIIGARLISPVKGLRSGIPIVKHHHERVNGRGYPDGLRGDSIPHLARIVAVADALDAIVSPRPYRKSRTLEEAKEEIRKNIGSQFDPEIAGVLIQLIEEGVIKTSEQLQKSRGRSYYGR